MKIIIGGDVVPTENSKKYFAKKNFTDNIDPSFINMWHSADVRLFNLECPICGMKEALPIKKIGPNLSCDEKCMNGIEGLSPSLVCLANNHILDYGVPGLKNTVNVLNKGGISTTGLLDNIDAEPSIFFYSKDGLKVGIYNICETEFCAATHSNPGADPYRENYSCEVIARAKKECDFLIVVFHGGKEFYRYPSPDLQDKCRSFIRSGADYVTCQHSHCIGCEEEYLKGRILYGQGNFLFDSGNDEFWNSGLAVELNIENKGFSVEYIVLEKKSPTFVLSENEDIIKSFKNRSKKVYDREFIEKEYGKFADRKIDEYLDILSTHTFFDKVYRKIFGRYLRRRRKQRDYLNMLNSIRCEAHREALIRGLEDKADAGKS